MTQTWRKLIDSQRVCVCVLTLVCSLAKIKSLCPVPMVFVYNVLRSDNRNIGLGHATCLSMLNSRECYSHVDLFTEDSSPMLKFDAS